MCDRVQSHKVNDDEDDDDNQHSNIIQYINDADLMTINSTFYQHKIIITKKIMITIIIIMSFI